MIRSADIDMNAILSTKKLKKNANFFYNIRIAYYNAIVIILKKFGIIYTINRI